MCLYIYIYSYIYIYTHIIFRVIARAFLHVGLPSAGAELEAGEETLDAGDTDDRSLLGKSHSDPWVSRFLDFLS